MLGSLGTGMAAMSHLVVLVYRHERGVARSETSDPNPDGGSGGLREGLGMHWGPIKLLYYYYYEKPAKTSPDELQGIGNTHCGC